MKTITLPDGDYSAEVIDTSIMSTPSGEIGLIWVLKVIKPVRLKGVDLAKITRLDPDDPGTFEAATAELGLCGLSAKQIYEGDVPRLLKGLHLQIRYKAANEATGSLEAVQILAKIAP